MRILALLRALSQGRSPTVRELAAEFRTRRETIYRDLRVLQDAGYPITGDEHGRLSRPRLLAARAPEIRFSASETEALLVAAAQAQVTLPAAGALASAVLKLKALAQSEPGWAPPGLDEMVDSWVCGWKDYREHEGRIAVLIEAILRNRRCHVEYRRPSRKPKSYDFDPYRFLSVAGGLYVVGQVPDHPSTATLAVDRLLSVSLSQTTFVVDAAFDPQKLRLDAFGVSSENPIDVVLRFRADQAPYVCERIWHPTQRITELPDGGVELRFRAGGPFELRRWILGWGDAVEVIAPDELRRDAYNVLNSAASRYR